MSSTFLKIFKNFLRFLKTGEGGIWTLAPGLPVYTLSRGASSATWVLLHEDQIASTKALLIKTHCFRQCNAYYTITDPVCQQFFGAFFLDFTRFFGLHNMLWSAYFCTTKRLYFYFFSVHFFKPLSHLNRLFRRRRVAQFFHRCYRLFAKHFDSTPSA